MLKDFVKEREESADEILLHVVIVVKDLLFIVFL
jgi:hypothetical protein